LVIGEIIIIEISIYYLVAIGRHFVKRADQVPECIKSNFRTLPS